MSNHEKNEQLVLAEMQVLLAQLRTQLSIVRAGMGLIAGSVSIAFILFTSNWLERSELAWLDLPAKGMLGMLTIVGLWRLLNAERKLKRIHKLIRNMEKQDKLIDQIIV